MARAAVLGRLTWLAGQLAAVRAWLDVRGLEYIELAAPD